MPCDARPILQKGDNDNMEKKDFHFLHDFVKHPEGNYKVPTKDIFAIYYNKTKTIYHNLDFSGSTRIYIFMPKY